MCKTIMKLLVVTLILTGVFLLFSGSRVSALVDNCPGAPYGNWGNGGSGEGSGLMASLMVRATDTNGDPLNVQYTLNSDLPGQPGQNARIFHWPIGTGRDASRNFSTGERLSDRAAGCNGWSVIAPGISGHDGNGYVLDCGDGFNISEYWISHVDNPGGAAGTWSLIDQNGNTLTTDLNNADRSAMQFRVFNGGNFRVALVWKPASTWSLSGQTTVDGNSGTISVRAGTSHTFSHTVTNNGPANAHYSWNIQDDNGGSFGNHGRPTGSAGPVGDEGSNPSNRQINFSVPASANNGDTFCQRIVFSNANGAGTGDGNSAKACVRVTPGGGYTLSYGCSRVDINSPHVIGHISYVTLSGTDSDQGGAGYAVGGDGILHLNYTAISPTITVTTLNYKKQVAADGTVTWPLESSTLLTFNCYHATCNIAGFPLVAKGNGPNDIVQAGQPFTVYVPVKNDNGSVYAQTIPSNAGGYPFSLTQSPDDSQGGFAGHGTGFSLNVGEQQTLAIPFNAPSNVRDFTLNFFPDFYGHGGIGDGCSITVPIYQEFNINPRASIINTDAENPTTVTYTSGGGLTTGSPTTAATHSWLDKQGAGCPSATDTHDTTDTYGDLDHTYVYNNPCINAGDSFCAHTRISPAHGWHGPHNDLFTSVATADSGCLKTVNRPYTHFFGNDVSAGGGFGLGTSCQKNAKGVIYAYNNSPAGAPNPANKGGTGAQFGAHAMEVISGLGTASLRGSAPTGLSGLAFANNKNIGGSTPNRTNGGFLGDAGLSNACVPDYFSDKPDSVTSDANTTATAGAGAAQQWHKVPTGSTLTLTGGTIPNGMNQVIFVEGNVSIMPGAAGGIKYDTTPRDSITDIPSFFLIVKNGNIRIDPGVKQLDGAYIAQPDTTDAATTNSTGIINTCWVGNNVNSIYNICKNQLVVNGAFVANRLLLTRSYSSLRYSQGGENNMSGAAHNCGNSGKDVPAGATSAQDCAAEIFNFSPELYMSQPAIKARFGAPTGKYDAITSLSPVL